MLAHARFDESTPDLSVFWEVYKRFVALPVANVNAVDGDMLLFQCALELEEGGLFDAVPHYEIDFTRQFSHEDEHGEYQGMEHLSCSFYYEPHPDFEAVTQPADWSPDHRHGDQLWGAPGDHAAEWMAKVAASPNFRAALRHRPRTVRIFQTPV